MDVLCCVQNAASVVQCVTRAAAFLNQSRVKLSRPLSAFQEPNSAEGPGPPEWSRPRPPSGPPYSSRLEGLGPPPTFLLSPRFSCHLGRSQAASLSSLGICNPASSHPPSLGSFARLLDPLLDFLAGCRDPRLGSDAFSARSRTPSNARVWQSPPLVSHGQRRGCPTPDACSRTAAVAQSPDAASRTQRAKHAPALHAPVCLPRQQA